MIRFKCVNCGAPMESPDSRFGQPEKCPKCNCATMANDQSRTLVPLPPTGQRTGELGDWLWFLRGAMTLAAIIVAISGLSMGWGVCVDHGWRNGYGSEMNSATTFGKWPEAILLEFTAIVLLLLRPAAKPK